MKPFISKFGWLHLFFSHVNFTQKSNDIFVLSGRSQMTGTLKGNHNLMYIIKEVSRLWPAHQSIRVICDSPHISVSWLCCPPSFPPSVPSSPPQDVCLRSLSSTSINVSWVAPPTDSHHRKVVGYILLYQAFKGKDVELHQVSGISADSNSYVLEGLEKWTEYYVWVRADTDVGPGPESPPALIRTLEDGTLPMS